MIEPYRIAAVLGGRTVLHRSIRSLLDLNRAVAHGLPKASLRRTVERVFPNRKDVRVWTYRVVPEATFKRRRQRLTPAESERTERLARVIAAAEHTWGDRDDARRFLTTPHPGLGGATPLQAAMTELGARLAEDVLARIEYGLPA